MKPSDVVGALEDRFAAAPEVLSINEAAAVVGVARQTIAKWIDKAEITAYRVSPNANWIIYRDDLWATMRAGRNAQVVEESSAESTTSALTSDDDPEG